MGYYTQHLIKIIPESDATVENYKRVASAIRKVEQTDYDYRIHDGVMDDSHWNSGDGTKWYQDEGFDKMSKVVPDLTIRLDFIGETYVFDGDAAGSVTMKDGNEIECNEFDADRFYEVYGYIPGTYILSNDDDSVEYRGSGTHITGIYRHDYSVENEFKQ